MLVLVFQIIILPRERQCKLTVHSTEIKNVLQVKYCIFPGHCKALEPKWNELGEHFKDNADIVIAKMDSTANEVEEVNVEGFPTLKLFKKDTNEIVDYRGQCFL